MVLASVIKFSVTENLAWPVVAFPVLNSRGMIFSKVSVELDSNFTRSEASIIPFRPYFGAHATSSISTTYM